MKHGSHHGTAHGGHHGTHHALRNNSVVTVHPVGLMHVHVGKHLRAGLANVTKAQHRGRNIEHPRGSKKAKRGF